MSLKEKTILEETVNNLIVKAWNVFEASLDIWSAVTKKEKVSKSLFKKMKERLEEFKEACEELP